MKVIKIVLKDEEYTDLLYDLERKYYVILAEKLNQIKARGDLTIIN